MKVLEVKSDLHVHSTASDGWFSPVDVVDLAASSGLDLIAFCDHDSVDGLLAALPISKRLGVEIVPAVELSTRYRGENVHLLGYWIDPTNECLLERLHRLSWASTERIFLMVENLSRVGMPIDYRSLRELASGGAYRRAHLGRALIAQGYAKTLDEAFERFIGDDAPFYVPFERIDIEEGIKMIQEAGGIPFIAHPHLSGVVDRIETFCRMGVRGIEAFHSKHTEGQCRELLRVAERFGLHVSGGSDWHGDPNSPVRLGHPSLPELFLEDFMSLRP